MVQRKRKLTAVEQTAAPTTTSRRMQTSIHAFAKISKATQQDPQTKRRKTAPAEVVAPAPVAEHQSLSISSTKRKRDLDTVDERTATPDLPEAPSTPRSKRTKNEHVKLPETPSKGALALFDSLKISPKGNQIPCTLPEELEQMKDLYAAFLAALSLYYSHNGTASPVNVRKLLPMVTSHWKKRSVMLEDVQRILALETTQRFTIQDYGRAGICITRTATVSRPAYRLNTYIDETELNASFEEALTVRWTAWTSRAEQENLDVATFLNQLPLCAITPNESAQKASPMFARGQQRLLDIKASQASGHANTANATPNSLPARNTAPIQNRSTALLDRIMAKQTLLANLPAGPSKTALERKAALHRVEDVSRILVLLVGARDRCSFSLPVLTQHLHQSLRNPIASDEILRCLEVMQKDITPGFVRVVQTGDVKGVVVSKGLAVSVPEVRARVARACEELMRV